MAASGSTPDVVITLRLWQRIFVVAFGLVWFGGLGVGLYVVTRDSGVPIPMVFMLLFGAFVFNSVLRRKLVASGEELVVRNAIGTKTMQRSEIADFRVGQGSGGAGARMILVVPHEGEIVSAQVSAQLFSRENDRLARTLAELNAWLAR